MYAHGDGVAQDDVCAYVWWNIAAANGNTLGRLRRNSLESQMTPEQVTKAQMLSRDLVPQ